jgi:hypothetical protein
VVMQRHEAPTSDVGYSDSVEAASAIEVVVWCVSILNPKLLHRLQ